LLWCEITATDSWFE